MCSCWWTGRASHCGDVVLPLLQQEDGAGGAGNAFGEERVAGSVEQRGVFGAVDEAGEVAIVPVGPAGGFFDERGVAGEVADDGAGHVEEDVVGGAGEPDERHRAGWRAW